MAASKRPSLVQTVKAAADRAAAPVPAPAPHQTAPQPLEEQGRNSAPRRSRALTDAGATTAIHIPRDDLHLLRLVSVARANRQGGRPSVSDVLRDLINRHRAELEREAGE